MEEICTACEDGEGTHSMGLFCVRERRRRWRTWRRIWSFDWDEEASGQTWDEMLFGGGDGVLGFNWNEATAEQIWDEMFSAGYGLIMSFNDAPIEEIWGETIVGEEDLFFGWDEMFFLCDGMF